MKSYTLIKEGKLAEYDSSNADNSQFWDTQWLTQNVKKSLKKSSTGYLGSGMNFLLDELQPGDAILEGGCGKGQIVKALESRGFKIVGIDFAESTIDIINEVAPELEIVRGDLREMPFEDKLFDVYMSFGVIEHFTDQKEVEKIIAEAKRVTKDRVFISVPYLSKALLKKYKRKGLNEEVEGKNFYQYYFNDEEFKKLLISHGLTPYKKELYATYIGLKRHSKFFGFLNRFKIFRYVAIKCYGMLNRLFGKQYGHMIAYWATVNK